MWYGGKCREIRGIFATLFTLVKVIWIIERVSKYNELSNYCRGPTKSIDFGGPGQLAAKKIGWRGRAPEVGTFGPPQ